MAPASETVCQYCLKLLSFTDKLLRKLQHHPDVGSLIKSGNSCAMCRMICEHWSLPSAMMKFPETDQKTADSLPITMNFEEVKIMDSGVFWAVLYLGIVHRPQMLTFEFASRFSITACSAKSPAARHAIWQFPFTSIQDKMSTLKLWLNDCIKNHPYCKVGVGVLPKRLIDVGLMDNPRPKLVSTEGLKNQVIQYATLSHCWGGSLPIRTTIENQACYNESILDHLVPKSFRAWVLVQDDYAEWEAEASVMKDIYSGSLLTIAATDAKDSSGGCFINNHSSSHHDNEGMNYEICEKSCILFKTLATTEIPATIVRMQPSDIRAAPGRAVISKRGWALQEMVLSTRIIHCMHTELHWQCKCSYLTEPGMLFDSGGVASEFVSGSESPRYIALSDAWWKWVVDYSGRQFTELKDRLPALAGIVDYYQKNTGDVPLIGLWRHSIARGLGWIRMSDPSVYDRATLQAALPNMPSWSWLSCNGAVEYEDLAETIEDHIQILEWTITWTSLPFTSNIQSSRLIIVGAVKEIRLTISHEAGSTNPPYFDIEDEQPDPTQGVPWRTAGQFDDNISRQPTSYPCLLLQTETKDAFLESKFKEIFLILEHCGEESHIHIFKRIGCGHIRGKTRTFDTDIRKTLRLI